MVRRFLGKSEGAGMKSKGRKKRFFYLWEQCSAVAGGRSSEEVEGSWCGMGGMYCLVLSLRLSGFWRVG